MEIRVLQYFLAIAREQSIIRAAESLHLSHPTLSTQIKNMEEELGKQLLICGTKGSRKVTLTEEEMIRDFLGWFDKGQQAKQLELLEHQREYLLGRVHTDERRISCLDYLIYQIQRTPTGKKPVCKV